MPQTEITEDYEKIDALMEEAFAEVGNFSVPIIGANRKVASGTLVRVGERVCILTAGHVRRVIRSGEKVHISIYRGQHSFPIDTSMLYEICPAPNDAEREEGPDLALWVVLEPEKRETIASIKSVYSLNPATADAVSQWNAKLGPLVLCGHPKEGVAFVDEAAGQFDASAAIRQLFTNPEFVTYEKRGEYDYIRVFIEKTPNGPKDYEGCSGGGLWWVPLVGSPEKGLEGYTRPVLVGVVYYQQEMEDRFEIICHGYDSIHRVMEQLGRGSMET